MRKRSKKRIALDKEYSDLRRNFLTNYPYCQAKLPGCTALACDVHHKSGRSLNYLNVSTWLSVCRSCHEWIHKNPIESKTLKLLE